MSLFASLDQEGDIWSINGISFGSAIQDILDKDEFTLEELLVESDLLQEVKSVNHKLIQFLASEPSIQKMIEYVSSNASAESSDDLRSFKYPYISCEVICLEVLEIMNMFMRFENGKYFKQLLSILDQESPLDCYLAGYFEKLLEMFFRKETSSAINIINEGGLSLFSKFLRHIDNYSIMQLVQRLMLPHIPFFINDNEDIVVELPQCCWAFVDDVSVLLVQRMLTQDPDHSEIPMHIADLLITVIQLSPPGSELLANLCCDQNLNRLLVSAFDGDLNSAIGQTRGSEVVESGVGTSLLSVPDSHRLSSICVLESMISRLCESMSIGDDINSAEVEENARIVALTQECVQQLCVGCCSHALRIQQMLASFVAPDSQCRLKSQSKVSFACLGQIGLQLVRLVEALVRLGTNYADEHLCATGCFATIINLLFAYPLNSLLHLSIQRIFLMIVEGGEQRRSTQLHILIECSLLVKICDYFGEFSEAVDGEMQGRHNRSKEIIAGCRSPLIGHIIVVAQAIAMGLHDESSSQLSLGDVPHGSTNIASESGAAEAESTEQIESKIEDNLDQVQRVPSPTVGSGSSPNYLREELRTRGLLEQWLRFQENVLVGYVNRFNSETAVNTEDMKTLSPQANQNDGGPDVFVESFAEFDNDSDNQWFAFSDDPDVEGITQNFPTSFSFGENNFAEFNHDSFPSTSSVFFNMPHPHPPSHHNSPSAPHPPSHSDIHNSTQTFESHGVVTTSDVFDPFGSAPNADFDPFGLSSSSAFEDISDPPLTTANPNEVEFGSNGSTARSSQFDDWGDSSGSF